MSKIKVISGFISKREATLYTESGETILIKQGDPRMKYVVEEVIPAIRDNGVALYDPSTGNPNYYGDLEKQTNGVVKFFSIARKKLKQFFGASKDDPEPVEEGVIYGEVPKQEPDSSNNSAEQFLSENATPSTSEKFDPSKFNKAIDLTESGDSSDYDFMHETESGDTVVALVDGKVIPDAERLTSQIKHSVTSGDTKGIQNMLKRLASVIDKRRHSVEDFVRFVERADLAISDEGMLIAYKVLRAKNSSLDGLDFEFVDCHTERVSQGVGTVVYMDEKLVDPNRRNECSNGLHIARRSYLLRFGGDACTLCYVDPVDVIAVPYEDANKIRVTKYTILAKLTEDQYDTVRQNKPITKVSGGKELIAKATQHLFPLPTKAVKIGADWGRCLSAKMINNGAPAPKEAGEIDTTHATTLDNLANERIDPINPSRIDTEKKTTSPESKPAVTKKPYKRRAHTARRKKGSHANSPRAQIARMLEGQTPSGMPNETKDAIISLKRQAKKSWGALEVDPVFATELIVREKELKSKK